MRRRATLRELIQRTLSWPRRRRLEREMEEEIANHLAMAAAEHERRGLDPVAARRAARRDFGAPERVRESWREQRGLPRLGSLLQDLRLAVRSLARSPAFAAVALLTVALGIGVNGALFSLVDAVLLQPLPYPEPERLVRLYETNEAIPKFPLSPGNFTDYRDGATTLDGLAIYTRLDLLLTDRTRPERLAALRVSAGYFELLGGEMRHGRGFRDEEMYDESRVVVLSDAFHRRRFGGDPAIVGSTLLLNGVEATVVGVLAPGFEHVGGDYRSTAHGETVDAWWPVDLRPEQARRNWHFMNGVGRLKPGATVADATADLGRVAEQLEAAHPDSNEGWRVRVEPLQQEIVGAAGKHAVLLLGAGLALLLIACANVASLFLARAATRRPENAVRSALGAGRLRIARHLLAESLVLVTAGGLAGVGIAAAGVELLRRLLPPDFPRLHALALDGWALAAIALLTLLTACAAGLAPSLIGARTHPTEALSGAGRGTADRGSFAARKLLVVAEVALASALLVGAGLLLRSFWSLTAEEAGFTPDGSLAFTLSHAGERYAEATQRIALVHGLAEAARRLPGVTSVGAATDLPWSGYDENSSFGIVGDTVQRERGPGARFHAATPGYFASLGWPLLRGRAFAESDRPDAPPVVLVNEALVRAYLPDGDAVGRRLDVWGEEREIVGVVGDVGDLPGEAAEPAFWFPYAQMSHFNGLSFVVRTGGEPLAHVDGIRTALAGLDPELPIADLRTLDELVAAVHADRRATTLLVNVFAVLAALLFAIGAYGVLAYAVVSRRRELAIRLALGARRPQLVGDVLGQGLRLAGLGLALGLTLALAGGGLLSGFLYGVSPRDPVAIAAAAALTLGVALAAGWLPALRAAQGDPAESLQVG